jgi:ribosomal protein L25 (general stress protein Ctc)
MAPKKLKSEFIDGPKGTRVAVRFYDDDSIRFVIYGTKAKNGVSHKRTPLAMTECFLTGQKHAVIKLKPDRASA